MLQGDPQLSFLRCNRDLMLSGLEQVIDSRGPEETAITSADLARSVAPHVVTPEFRQEARELLEDCLRFRSWKDTEHHSLVTALSLASIPEPGDRIERNPLWLAVVTLSIEDMVALEGALRPAILSTSPPPHTDEGERRRAHTRGLATLLDGALQPRQYLFQPLFQATHRTARMITGDDLSAAIPLYEILPMFLAVFQVWAEQSEFGTRAVETLPQLHRDVVEAFQKAATRTLDEDAQAAVAAALAESSREAHEAGNLELEEQLRDASQFCASFPWKHSPVFEQFLLKLCSSPELSCVGPGAAEALRLASDPTIAEHFHGYGQALLQQGELRGAGRVFAAGLEFLGNHWQGLLDLALVYRALGEEKVARKVFREALAAPDLSPEGQTAIEAEMAGVSRGLRFAPLF